MKKSKNSFVFVLLFLLSALGVLGCRGPSEEAGSEGERISLAAHTVRQEKVDQRYVASGTLRGRQTAVLTSKASAYVQELRFKAGDRVEAGQVLVVLEDQELGGQAPSGRGRARGSPAGNDRSGKRSQGRRGRCPRGCRHLQAFPGAPGKPRRDPAGVRRGWKAASKRRTP